MIAALVSCLLLQAPTQPVAKESLRARVEQLIDEAIANGKTETVFLKEPLPELIVYWTVSVGASGELRFARDVYGRDEPVLRALDSL